MKRCILIIITCFYAVVSAQTTFTGPYTIFKPKVLRPKDVQAADIDGDGDLDVVGASYGDYSPVWFENTGEGEFSGPKPVGQYSYTSRTIFTGDLDGDGDIDVVSGSTDHDLICWYKNDGSGNFTVQEIITTDVDYVRSLFLADLDGDTDLDLLSASLYDNKIAWYENDGTGHFSAQNIINDPESAGEFSVYTVYAADIDEDGDQDVLTSITDTKKTIWYENDGHGTFVSCNTVGEGIDGQKVIAADVDQDGDLDVFVSAYENVALSVNTGNGVFSGYTVINAGMNYIYDISTADMDNDGDIDLIAVSHTRISWFENIDGLFSQRHDIAYPLKKLTSLCPADMDQDGHTDIIYTDSERDELGFCKNSGAGVFQQPERLCTSVGITEICSADFDNDGDADIASALFYDEGIAWYKNSGVGCFSEPVTIFRGISYITTNESLFAIDLDEDSDTDLLYSCLHDSAVGWFENTGEAGFTGPHIIDLSIHDAPLVKGGDIDGDGDNDVLWCSNHSNTLAWHENDGSGVFPEQHIISSQIGDITDGFLADLDGDGDKDVLFASRDDLDGVGWYENNGSTFEFNPNMICSGVMYSTIYAADLDGDQALDVLYLSDSGLVWHKNDGSGQFSDGIYLSRYEEGSSLSGDGIVAADMDMDQDMDIVVGTFLDHKVAWYENIGSGEFSDEIILTGGDQITGHFYSGGIRTVLIIDIDGDGDKDIVFANSFDDTIKWLRNMFIETGIDNSESNPVPDGFGLTAYPNPFNQSVTISYTGTEQSTNASILIFDVSGKQVKELKPEIKKSGTCTAVWDGTGFSGTSLPSGVYICMLCARGTEEIQTVRIALVR